MNNIQQRYFKQYGRLKCRMESDWQRTENAKSTGKRTVSKQKIRTTVSLAVLTLYNDI